MTQHRLKERVLRLSRITHKAVDIILSVVQNIHEHLLPTSSATASLAYDRLLKTGICLAIN